MGPPRAVAPAKCCVDKQAQHVQARLLWDLIIGHCGLTEFPRVLNDKAHSCFRNISNGQERAYDVPLRADDCPLLKGTANISKGQWANQLLDWPACANEEPSLQVQMNVRRAGPALPAPGQVNRPAQSFHYCDLLSSTVNLLPRFIGHNHSQALDPARVSTCIDLCPLKLIQSVGPI